MELPLPRDFSDHFIVAAIESAVAKGQLILIRGWEAGARGATTPHETERDRLVKKVMADRTAMEFEGGKYRFLSAARLSGRYGDGDYRPVPEGQARELVTRMATQLAKTPEERASWQKVIDTLAERRRGEGIILLRHAPPAQPPRVREDVPTPPPLRPQVAEQDWIEIQIEYEDGSPFDGSCVVLLPDGRRTEGPPDAAGVLRLEGLVSGRCELSFPELDARASAQG